MGRRTFLHRLRPAVRRRHDFIPRRRHRLSQSRHRVGNRRTLRRHQDVHCSHRASHVHALRRILPRCTRSHYATRNRVRRRAAESRSVALGADASRRGWQVGIRHRQLVANRIRRTRARHSAFDGNASRQSRSRRPRRRSRRSRRRRQSRSSWCRWTSRAQTSLPLHAAHCVAAIPPATSATGNSSPAATSLATSP